MTPEQRMEWLSTGRLSLGVIHQLVESDLVARHVAKIRGIIISRDGHFMHATAQEAQTFGERALADLRARIQARAPSGATATPITS